MYDEKGKLTWEAELDIYGKVRSFGAGSLSDCPFRYQGQYEDIETGLYYNRFRYYSPDEGMYISQDPIGLLGNNPTLYGYVKDTNGWVDRCGLEGAVEAFLKVGDKTYHATSGGKVNLSDDFGKIVDDAIYSISLDDAEPFHGKCAEIKAIQEALDDGVSLDQLKGASIYAKHVKSGDIMEPCTCCRRVIQRLGIKVKCP